jgi:hypothetical protein
VNALDFLPLEKAVGADTVNDLAQVLGVNRRQIMHWRSVGLTVEEAVQLAEKADEAAGEIWPDIDTGKAIGVKAAGENHEEPDGIVWCDPPGSVRAKRGGG